MPTLFQELVINGTWDFYNFLQWNLALWIFMFFGGPFPVNQQLYKEYIIVCTILSIFISIFYVCYILSLRII